MPKREFSYSNFESSFKSIYFQTVLFNMIKDLFIIFFLMSGIIFKATNAHNYCKQMLKLGNAIDQKIDEILEKESCCTLCQKGSTGKPYSVIC